MLVDARVSVFQQKTHHPSAPVVPCEARCLGTSQTHSETTCRRDWSIHKGKKIIQKKSPSHLDDPWRCKFSILPNGVKSHPPIIYHYSSDKNHRKTSQALNSKQLQLLLGPCQNRDFSSTKVAQLRQGQPQEAHLNPTMLPMLQKSGINSPVEVW